MLTDGDGTLAHESLTKADLIAEVARVAALPRKEAAAIVERILNSMVRAIERSSPHRPEPQDRGAGGGTRQENSLLQAQQRTARRGAETLNAAGEFLSTGGQRRFSAR